jgi:hypothetical protein
MQKSQPESTNSSLLNSAPINNPERKMAVDEVSLNLPRNQLVISRKDERLTSTEHSQTEWESAYLIHPTPINPERIVVVDQVPVHSVWGPDHSTLHSLRQLFESAKNPPKSNEKTPPFLPSPTENMTIEEPSSTSGEDAEFQESKDSEHLTTEETSLVRQKPSPFWSVEVRKMV